MDLYDVLNALMDARNKARALGDYDMEDKIQALIKEVAYKINPKWDEFIKPLEWY